MNKEINWKQAHDMQQKLVISYVLENEKLKDRIKELELSSNKLEACDFSSQEVDEFLNKKPSI